MVNKPLRVAVIGAGGWGYQHARAFSSRRDTVLTSVTGRTEERTRRRAEEFGVPYYLDIAEMLEKDRPDFVSVCMPGQGTFAPTMEVIRAGVPLLVEKPLAYKLDEAETMIAEAKKKNLFFAIDFNHRYSIPAQMAREDIEKGRLGDVVFALWRFGHGSGSLNHPYLNLIEAQCHGLDLLEFLCGPIASVQAEMTDMTGKGSYSTFSLSLRFAGGGVGSFLGTFDSSENYEFSHVVEINGTRGRILMEDSVCGYRFQSVDSRRAEVWNPAFFRDDERSFNRNLDRHLDALIPALREGREPPVPAEKGLRALRLAHAAIESFETGRRVTTAE
ncbi:MAG: Gfo/Idh/MocA family oxidoreductase [Clostridia bacterium]|nr:Gfo/Idh/MocA family oxidoreductase [Clostridia bacterium]MBQ4193978.1 Gfo/Idh/MocA family oxidoreductase [Clostridia bacterium]MBQ4350211.1 Gfo/Idh/MocA family oxidoreductase [Clostridia bacterium]